MLDTALDTQYTLTHLDVFVGLQLADVLFQEEQIQRQIVPLATRGGQDAHCGQRLVGFQEAGISMAEEGTETGIDHHGNQWNEQDQVDEAGNKVKQTDCSLTCREEAFNMTGNVHTTSWVKELSLDNGAKAHYEKTGN